MIQLETYGMTIYTTGEMKYVPTQQTFLWSRVENTNSFLLKSDIFRNYWSLIAAFSTYHSQ